MLWSNLPYPSNGGVEKDIARSNDNITQNPPFIDGHVDRSQKLSFRLIMISLITDIITVPHRADMPSM